MITSRTLNSSEFSIEDKAVNNLIDNLLRENIERLVRKKCTLGFFSSRFFFCFNIRRPGKGSKYWEFPDLSECITCMEMYEIHMGLTSFSEQMLGVVGCALW